MACEHELAGTHVGEYTVTVLEVAAIALADALAINDAGQVVGYALEADGCRRAVLWHDGTVVDLGTLPGTTCSEAWDINGQGQVVGLCHDGGGRSYRAFVWDSGGMRRLPDLGGPASASAINAAGEIAGGSYARPASGASEHHAVLWRGEELLDLGTLPGGVESHAWDVNDAGLVVGVAQDAGGAHRATMWQAGAILDLGTLGGHDAGARAINAHGQIVGAARTAGGGSHAFLWHHGEITDLGTLRGAHHSRARAINDVGQIVGSATRLAAEGPQHRAVVWRDGRLEDLNDLAGADRAVVLCRANGINSRGQIVGQGVIGGREHAFLLTPRG